MIRVQAPHLTKSSTLVQLDKFTTAADVVNKFKLGDNLHKTNRYGLVLVLPSSSHELLDYQMTFPEKESVNQQDVYVRCIGTYLYLFRNRFFLSPEEFALANVTAPLMLLNQCWLTEPTSATKSCL